MQRKTGRWHLGHFTEHLHPALERLSFCRARSVVKRAPGHDDVSVGRVVVAPARLLVQQISGFGWQEVFGWKRNDGMPIAAASEDVPVVPPLNPSSLDGESNRDFWTGDGVAVANGGSGDLDQTVLVNTRNPVRILKTERTAKMGGEIGHR